MEENSFIFLLIDNNLIFLGRLVLSMLMLSFFLFLLIRSKRLNTYFMLILQSTLVLLLLLLILSFCPQNVRNLWVFFILIYAYLTLLIYVLLYYWRKLEVSLGSLIRIYCNLIILNLFILSINKLGKGLPNPIYVENLSVFSIYKYTLFLCGSILAILGYIIIKKYFPSRLSNLEILTFPYLKEEVRVFLYTWNESVFGSLCSSLIDLLYTSSRARYMYFTIHFFLFYFIRIVQTGFFLNFVFLHGDLRWNIYLLPFSFLSWLLRFFEYYFNTFLKGTDEYIRSCLNVTLKDPLTPKKTATAYFLNGNALNFELTPFALSEGFQNDNNTRVYLGTQWLRLTHIIYFFSRYEKKLAYLNKAIFGFRVLSWITIIYIFFFSNVNVLLVWKLILSRSFFTSAPD